MLLSSYLAVFVPLVAALPAPQPSGTRYPWLKTRISDLNVICEKNDSDQMHTCNMKFYFYDPNSEPVQEVNGAKCDISWAWDGKTTERGPKNEFPGGFTVCYSAEGNLFQVQIERFHKASDWTILVSHKYWDDVHFKEPMQMPNSFTQFEMPELHPGEEDDEALGRFRYNADETIEAPVIGLS